MNGDATYLILGGDSKTGKYVCQAFKSHGIKYISTTRRPEKVDEGNIHFDYELPETYKVPAGIKHAFVLAAASGFEQCKIDPNSHKVNVELIPKAIISLIKQGIFVTYTSSNSVFGGETPWPKEYTDHAPTIEAAQQKSVSEYRLAMLARHDHLEERYNILRLTKILEFNTPPLPDWFRMWRDNQVVKPFRDFIFAPVSGYHVARSMMKMRGREIPGNFHLSGAENISYMDLANELKERLGIPQNLIEPTTSLEAGVKLTYQPKYSGLNMEKSIESLGLESQKLSSVIDDIIEEAVILFNQYK